MSAMKTTTSMMRATAGIPAISRTAAKGLVRIASESQGSRQMRRITEPT